MRTRISRLPSYKFDADLLAHPSDVEAQRAAIEREDQQIVENENKRDEEDVDYQYESQASTDYSYSQSSQETWYTCDDGLGGSQSQDSFASSNQNLTASNDINDAVTDALESRAEFQEAETYSVPQDNISFGNSPQQYARDDKGDEDRPYPETAPTPEFVPSSQTWDIEPEDLGYPKRAPTSLYEPASQEYDSRCSFCSTPERANTPT